MNITDIKTKIKGIWSEINQIKPKTTQQRKAANRLLNKLGEFEDELDMYAKSELSNTTDLNLTIGNHSANGDNHIIGSNIK